LEAVKPQAENLEQSLTMWEGKLGEKVKLENKARERKTIKK